MIPTDEMLLSDLEERIAVTTRLVEAQRVRVQNLTRLGSTQKLPAILLKTWTESLSLFHWQRALLLWSSADGALDLSKLQLSPSLRRTPDIILEAICDDLRAFGAGSSVSSDEFKAIVYQVVSKRMSLWAG